MKIAMLGNGKMGKKIKELAKKKGHDIVCVANSKNPGKSINLKMADVAIDFSTPNTAFDNISNAINNRIPVVSGTTAWLQKLEKINELCKKKEGAFLYAPNFSLGVNIFFEINRKLALLMHKHNYQNEIYEVHHSKKLDNPSGTAIYLAKQISEIFKKEPNINSERTGNIAGIHEVKYTSNIDEILIKHTANNRDGFAIGAIIAAEWIIGKKGIYGLQDILNE